MFDVLSDELFWKLGGAFVILLITIYRLVIKTFEQKLLLSEMKIQETITKDLARNKKEIEDKIKEDHEHLLKNLKNVSGMMDQCFDKKIRELKRTYEDKR